MDASSAVRLFAFKTHVSESGGFHGFHQEQGPNGIHTLYRWYRFTYTCIMQVQQFAISMVEVM